MNTSEDHGIAVWVQIARAHSRILNQVEQALRQAGLKPLGWYDVLLELDRAEEVGLRPYELEEKLLLRQYGVSRLVDRIEKAGYLKRVACADDGRGQKLIITKRGKLARQKMWPVYRGVIEETLGRKLSNTETADLATLLEKLTM